MIFEIEIFSIDATKIYMLSWLLKNHVWSKHNLILTSKDVILDKKSWKLPIFVHLQRYVAQK